MIKTSVPQLVSLTTAQKLEFVGELWDEVREELRAQLQAAGDRRS